MKSVKLGLVQMRMAEQREKNLTKALRMVKTAADRGANVVCLPELFDSLYFPQEERSNVVPEAIPNATTRALSAAAKENGIVLVGGSLYEKSKQGAYNTATVFDADGSMLGRYRKVHIPQDPSFYEQDYFYPGDRYEVFETSAGKIGVLICFDQWYPEPARIAKLLGAQILFYPTAIGTVAGVDQVEGDWQSAWEAVQRGHAIANSLVVAAVNRVGVEREMRFWGGSFVCDQFGTTLAHADTSEQVLVATCDLDLATNIEKGWGFLRNRKPKTYGRLVK
jgi:predicted amidohydrolase